MGSEVPSQLTDETIVVEAPLARDCEGKRNHAELPKRIHKAEREKLKREHLNDLFLDLANALELDEQNSGKASILCETTRLLKDLFCQIECLKKENASLLSESRYVTIEKNELKEETTSLANQIEALQSELKARSVPSKLDLNVPAPLEFPLPELISNFPCECVGLPVAEAELQQTHAVLVVPVRPDLQRYPTPDVSKLALKQTPHVSKPHARYPTAAESWQSRLLREQQSSDNK